MGVTLRARSRCSHPGRHGGIHAIDHSGIAEFFIARATFVVGFGVAMKGGGDELFLSWIWQEIAGNLFNCELIERHVGIEGTNDPIAVSPDGASGIVGIASGVGITR